MRPAQLSLAAAAILAVGDAAYNCEVCIDPALPPSPPSATAAFCPENDWYVCLDDAEGRTWAAADATAQRHYIDTLAQITNTTNTDAAAGIGTPCEDALHAWICATHLPVCEASTHGRGVCDTEFTAVTQPACAKLQWQDANESSLGARLTRELASVGRNADKGTVVSDDRGSCFRLDYAGPNYWNWIIGFALCMVFAAMSPLALNLQKSSIMRNDALPLAEQAPVYRQPKWMCAVALLVSCSLVDFVAYGLAPQSLLTPLGAMVLVYNMIIARFYGEAVGRVEILATGVITVGTLLCIVFADHYSPSYSFSDILDLWYTNRMLWYVILVPLFAAAHAVPAHYIAKHDLTSHPIDGPKYARLLCAGYAGAAGIIGAQAILFAKQTMELLKAWGLGEPIWAHAEVYFIVLGIPAGMVGNLTFLNKALAIFDALQVVPIYQTYWMIAGTIGGFVYFNELEEMDALSKAMFFLGALISVGGIVILSTRRQPGGLAEGEDKYGRVDKRGHGGLEEEEEEEEEEGGLDGTDVVEVELDRNMVTGAATAVRVNDVTMAGEAEL
jgi:hypothetical protein